MVDDRLASTCATALDWQRSLSQQDAQSPTLLLFLLRRYAATADPELLHTLEPALADAVHAATDAAAGDRPQWILLFVDACAWSPDDRLRETLASLTTGVLDQDFTAGPTGQMFRSIAASLAGAAAHPDEACGRELLRRAIHAMEDVVSASYQPGAGVAQEIPADRHRGRTLPDQIEAAAALVAAYFESARLPYSMLAEEFVQFAKRQWWNETQGCFRSKGCREDEPLTDEDFAANADSARLFCRLALLHRDEGYRHAAILAPEADYLADADRMIDLLATDALTRSAPLVALYGLALDDQLRLRTNLQ
jgi:hypothetical protein